MKQYLPFLSWIKDYKKEYLGGDLSAGLTVGVMLIPQGMAYAMLAGLPPIYGLYASTVPLIIYALFGTSRQLAVGPVAMIALLISSGVGSLATLGSTEFIGLAILLALMVGVIQFAMGLFRLGFLVNFLSHPVISGFTSAAAIIIGVSQLKHLFGISIPRGKVHETILNVIENFGDINLLTFVVGISGIIIMVIVKKINKRIPGPLIVVVLGMLVVYFMDLYQKGVIIVGDVPGGLPSFGMVDINMTSINSLIPIALTISFVGFMESIAVAKAIQTKHKDYDVVPNQELIGLGLANIIGSFFSAFPVTGGFSRTAVNDQAGARTGLASVVSAILIIITLLFLTSYFYYLPTAILAAIILVAVFGLIDFAEAKHLWKTDRRDLMLFVITALGTLVLGIEEGILLGVAISLIMIVYRVSYPHIAELGRIPGSDQYRNIKRHSNLEKIDNILIVRFDAQLYFVNTNYFKDYIYSELRKRKDVKNVIIHAGSISNIDSSAVHMIHDMMHDLDEYGFNLFFVELIGPIRDILIENGTISSLGKERVFLTVHEAVEYINKGVWDGSKEYSLQHN